MLCCWVCSPSTLLSIQLICTLIKLVRTRSPNPCTLPKSFINSEADPEHSVTLKCDSNYGLCGLSWWGVYFQVWLKV